MHCITLAELAAVLSQHAPAIIYRRTNIPSVAMVQYWASSRKRFELWHQAMARYTNAQRDGDALRLRRWWCQHIVVLEEVIVSEMLSRVVATLGAALDAISGTEEVGPITHAIHLSHLEAANRVQSLMLRGRGSSVQDAVRLNRLRTGVERWTDALVGRMCVQSTDWISYGFDQNRAATHARELRGYGHGPSRDAAAWLMNAAMRDMLSRRTTPQAALPEANQKVAESVMMMMQADLFDGVGALKSLWMQRIACDHECGDTSLRSAATASDAKASEQVDEYFSDDMHRWHLK
jgi:hypothetical protein